MSLQRRLLVYLAICAPLVWALALAWSVERARDEVNELFDTELVRLAQQLQATLPSPVGGFAQAAPTQPDGQGEGDVRDLAVAVWDAQGRLVLTDREGVQLRRIAGVSGFVDDTLEGELWRVYYLQSADGSQLVAAGQKAYERDELVFSLSSSQLVPWLLVLPVLLAAMAWGVRRALAPMRQLTQDLGRRRAEDLEPLPAKAMPAELQPLVQAINGLFTRIRNLLARERRFTADAAHELRTPLAVLRARWDVLRRSGLEQRPQAEADFEAGLERMDRMVVQLLTLSRAEAADATLLATEIDWRPIVQQVVDDTLPLLRRRRIELSCEWPAGGRSALPLLGEPDLLAALLRNLVDNAARYSPAGSEVNLRLAIDRIEVENEGDPLSAQELAALGERFSRPAGQQETGSGLGVSIVQRIAALHGLRLDYAAGTQGRGVRAILRPV